MAASIKMARGFYCPKQSLVGSAMIELYTWSTPNGRKISILLEELNVKYKIHPIDIYRGDQSNPAFVALNPNKKIPVIVDDDVSEGVSTILTESGAILIYLADKFGAFLNRDGVGRYRAIEWVMFQLSAVGPNFGQLHHFRNRVDQQPYAYERFLGETHRLYGVLNKRLEESRYLAGHDYGIADISLFPWIARRDWHNVDFPQLPNLSRWFDDVAQRPAVARGMSVPS
jgi:GST-like protein